MMNVTINNTINARCEWLNIEDMSSPKLEMNETKDGTISVATLGDAGLLKIRLYAKDEDLIQLIYLDDVNIKFDSGLVMKGVARSIESVENVANAADLEVQLFRV